MVHNPGGDWNPAWGVVPSPQSLSRPGRQEVQGRSCLTDFHGMELTRDKICSLIKMLGSWRNLGRKKRKKKSAMKKKTAPGCLACFFWGWGTTQLCWDYFIIHEIRIPKWTNWVIGTTFAAWGLEENSGSGRRWLKPMWMSRRLTTMWCACHFFSTSVRCVLVEDDKKLDCFNFELAEELSFINSFWSMRCVFVP